VKGGRGGIITHSQQFWRGGGIGLHSSTFTKMHSQQFWRGGNAWSAILEGRGYRITLFYACKNAWSAILSIRSRTCATAKARIQQFGEEGVPGYALAYLQKCMVSNFGAL